MRATLDLSDVQWRKSSYSNVDGGNCVELSDELPGIVPVRDSKSPSGPALLFPTNAWAAFISGLKDQTFLVG